MTRRIALLVNPTSGKGRGARLLEPVAARLRADGTEVDLVVGRDADEAFDRLRDRVAAGVDGVVAVGGDGLVNLALQVVAGTPLPLGVVPAGTGNDFARALGIPLDQPTQAVDLVVRGATSTVDLGRANGRWFGGVLGSGFDSMVNERANRMTWPTGRSRYNIAIVLELRTFRPVPYVLELDGEPWTTEAMLVAVGNSPSYGGGMKVCPDADLHDGLLDVTVLGPISQAGVPAGVPDGLQGHPRQPPGGDRPQGSQRRAAVRRRDRLRRRRARLGAAGALRGGGLGVARLRLTGDATAGT